MKQKSIQIEQLKTFSEKEADMIRDLLKLLNPNYYPLTEEDYKSMITNPNISFFIARDTQTQHIVGMLTQLIYRIPYAKKSYLDDIVVDEEYRGLGIGSQLVEKAISNAKAQGAVFIDLTSNPERGSGIRLYEKFGFKKRDTNVYRLNLNN